MIRTVHLCALHNFTASHPYITPIHHTHTSHPYITPMHYTCTLRALVDWIDAGATNPLDTPLAHHSTTPAATHTTTSVTGIDNAHDHDNGAAYHAHNNGLDDDKNKDNDNKDDGSNINARCAARASLLPWLCVAGLCSAPGYLRYGVRGGGGGGGGCL